MERDGVGNPDMFQQGWQWRLLLSALGAACGRDALHFPASSQASTGRNCCGSSKLDDVQDINCGKLLATNCTAAVFHPDFPLRLKIL